MTIDRNTPTARLSALLATTALVLNPLAVLAGDALPTHGTVVSGTASYGTDGSTLTVTQGSDRAIVNWGSFSIGTGNTVNFLQPSTTSAILNRVTGSMTSQIAGSLKANGQVYLINPNGIAISSTGSVKVGGGFVASTLDMADDDFLAGKAEFKGNGGSGEIRNDGVIEVGRGGYAALIGGTVKNDGLISAPLGKIGLGSGEQATLDFAGDGFLKVALPTRDGAEGEGALVENAGTLQAEGGQIVMTAATARQAARQAINMSGVAEAKTVGGRSGAIVIGGGEGGKVKVSGKLRASSQTASGGAVKVTGKEIALAGAKIDVSGATGGGSVKIGGDWHGGDTLATADTLTVDAATEIRADATESGNGGEVVLWSDMMTAYEGTISARGGAAGGNGGAAEVSGKARLIYDGTVDLRAPLGDTGTLLLDPYNVTISSAASANVSGLSPTGNDSVINVTTLQNQLALADVTISTAGPGAQDGNITVADALIWGGNILTLQADKNIVINAAMTSTGATANDGLVLEYGQSDTSGSYSINAPVNLKAGSLFRTKHGADTAIDYTVITDLGVAGSTTGTDLQGIRNDLDGNYVLGANIDASATAGWSAGAGFDPIGTLNNRFTGRFDGLGHTISGLTIVRSTNDVGLFGATGSGSDIRNVGMSGGSVTGESYVGGLVGYSSGAIGNAYATGAVTGTGNFVGGLAGTKIGGTISNAYATGAVTGTGVVGGLVGGNGGTISNAYATGAVTGTGDYVGGLVGFSSGAISHAYATGAVMGTATGNRIGGLVGVNDGTINASFYDKDTTGQDNGVGGGDSVTGVTALTTAQAFTQSSYSGFSFTNDWFMIDGETRPFLRSEYSTTITNAHQLQLMAMDLDASYTLGNDIDASETTGANASGMWSASGFSPIGDMNNRFTGDFDGLGHTISGLTIDRSSTVYVGLFGYAYHASISNVGMIGGSISGQAYVGGLVGLNFGLVDNAYATGTVTGYGNQVGGLAGSNSGQITNAFATGAVTGTSDYVGGLVGFNGGGGITNAYASGGVEGNDYVGGLAGGSIGAITSVYATGIVSGDTNVGGLVGQNQFQVTNAYATGVVEGSNKVGGLVGLNDGLITDAYATGSVTGSNEYVGGLVGRQGSGTISQAYATGSVKGTKYTGGLVGYVFSGTSIEHAYATGAVDGGDFTGGLVGFNAGAVKQAYATGAVDGDGFTGGLVGFNINDTITESFYDVNTTGQSNGTDGPYSTGVTGLTTAQMQDPFTFINAGWDFDTTWGMSMTGANGGTMMLRALSTGLFDDYVRLLGNSTKVYGDASPSLSAISVETGAGSGTVTLAWGSAITANTGVGTYSYGGANVLTVSDTGGRNAYVDYGSGALTITPRALTVTASDVSKLPGATATLGYGVSGLIAGDSVTSVGLSSAGAAASAPVGSYAITAANALGTGLGNYDITYVAGALTVMPVTATRNVIDVDTRFAPPWAGGRQVIPGIGIGTEGAAGTETASADGQASDGFGILIAESSKAADAACKGGRSGALGCTAGFMKGR